MRMVENSILKLIRFIVATANSKGYHSLWTIHIVKFLYLADYLNAKSEQKTITSWDWKFWNFGPWTADSYHAVNEAITKALILSKSVEFKHPSSKVDEANEYQAFFCDPDEITDQELESLGQTVIPNIRTRMALINLIEKYGCRTNPLLNYVYSQTTPMYGVKKGDLLDFSGLKWEETNNIKTIKIKTKKLKKAKEIMKKIQAIAVDPYHPPKGKFDETYHTGMELLDSEEYIDDNDDILTGLACIKDIALSD